MNVYLAGKMTGVPNYGYEAFTEAKYRLRDMGHWVLTPFDATNSVWIRHFGRDFNPFLDKCDYGSKLLHDCWQEDVRVLLWSECVALLDGWETSKGSRLEVQTALLFGKKIVRAVDFSPLNLVVEVNFTLSP